MPEIHLTEEQLERLDAVRADVEAAYVGPYGRVTPAGAIDYLLDTYTPPGDREDTPASTPAPASTGDAAGAAEETTATAPASASNGSGSSKSKSGGGGGGGSPLAAAAALLDENEDVWRKSGGDAPYEVDLPDGTTEAVRTKGEVKRLLFKHYR